MSLLTFFPACFRVPVMASDGKMEKDAAADSSTSVLSEEVCSGFYMFLILRASVTFSVKSVKLFPHLIFVYVNGTTFLYLI